MIDSDQLPAVAIPRQSLAAVVLTEAVVSPPFDPLSINPYFLWLATDEVTPSTEDAQVSAVGDLSTGNRDLAQATSSKRPLLRFNGALRAIDFDGVDDGLQTAAGQTWAASVDVMVALKPDAGETQFVLFRNATSSSFFGVGQDGNASTSHLNAGTPTAYVDGVALGVDDRNGLFDALMAGGTAHVMEYRGLDLMVAGNTFDTLAVGDFAGFEFAGQISAMIGYPSSISVGDRAGLLTYIGATYGLTL